MAEETPFAAWAVVELMGHRKIIGYASDVAVAGGKLLRVDVPAKGDQPAYSQYYGAGAIYCLSPVSEDIARAMIEGAGSTRPWYAYALPAALPKPADDCPGCGAAEGERHQPSCPRPDLDDPLDPDPDEDLL